MNDNELITRCMTECTDKVTKKQMAFMLGKQRNPYKPPEDDQSEETIELTKIISYDRLYEHFRSLARELDVLEPRTPEQIFKTHLEERKQNQ